MPTEEAGIATVIGLVPNVALDMLVNPGIGLAPVAVTEYLFAPPVEAT